MRTALDTNVLSALLSTEPGVNDVLKKLGAAKLEGSLLISGIVYAELLANPYVPESSLIDFFADTGVLIDFQTPEKLWPLTGRRFDQYARRRRRSGGGEPKRMLADFIVGAHALLQADRLMTLDPERYRQDFPELRLL